MPSSSEEKMVTKLFAGFLCVCCWLHGATVGVAVGDALDLAQFFLLSLGVCFVITAIYPTSRRLAASILFLACAVFLSSLVKSLVFFRTPNHASAVLPDIGHDFLPYIPIPPQVLLLFVASATALFVAFHPLKMVITRRLLLIYATLLMARTLLALLTFLPDSNPNCIAEEKSASAKDVVHHFLVSRKGVVEWLDHQRNTTLHGCRDSIYCGHATLLVLCGMTWHTYYHRVESPVNVVKSVVWIFAIMAMVSSLGRRETYTLDIVLSTYFAVTTWATYHRLANDVLTGHVFTSVWLIDKMVVYPLVEYMESEGVSSKRPSNIRLYRRDTKDDTELDTHVQPRRQSTVFRTSEY
ncbi:Aste57867_17234 [Aphanomyces stellatus]|uniref:Aste57867_17234 protein n=1 Tax=Aphanomyces stellatus TaxID=120398 RepID=A0A485L834_9STRA|nr:hypothetical protein As57867_017175 [Aphanomyces stellatus]VFT93990.1 Aste57867_17234 [Aphanomyces stellatus]